MLQRGTRRTGSVSLLTVAGIDFRIYWVASQSCQQSVSTAPSPSHASMTWVRRVIANELGRCGAELVVEVGRVGAALASHGRGHRFETCHAHQHKRFPGFAEAPVCQHAAAGNQLWCDRVGDGRTPACHAPRSRLGWLDQPCQRSRWRRHRYAYSHRIRVPSGLTMLMRRGQALPGQWPCGLARPRVVRQHGRGGEAAAVERARRWTSSFLPAEDAWDLI